jgi:nucleoside-diphosphate-sugar epimerase
MNSAQLEDLLSTPTDRAVETLARLEGDLVLLGVAGKMGPTLARMARCATTVAGMHRRIYGVARFTDAALEERLRAWDIEPIRCDLLDTDQVWHLPEAALVVYLVGRKFGSTGKEDLTWAVNTYLPGVLSQRYRHSRLVAFSTGNVYDLVPTHGGGAREQDPLAPRGEYAQSCLGRERIFEHFSRALQIPMALLRLNYACELRYGVLVDIAQRVLAGLPVDLSMGNVNVIWQGDANAMALCAFAHAASPPFVVNLVGPEQLSVRQIAEAFGERLGVEPLFVGVESATALLSNGQRGHRLFGYPRVPAGRMIEWIADWLKQGGDTLGKPTHFQVRDGKF